MKKTILFVAIGFLGGFTLLIGKLDFAFEDVSMPAIGNASSSAQIQAPEKNEQLLRVTPILPTEPETAPLPIPREEEEENKVGPLPEPMPEPAPVEPAPIKPQKPGPKPSPQPQPQPNPDEERRKKEERERKEREERELKERQEREARELKERQEKEAREKKEREEKEKQDELEKKRRQEEQEALEKKRKRDEEERIKKEREEKEKQERERKQEPPATSGPITPLPFPMPEQKPEQSPDIAPLPIEQPRMPVRPQEAAIKEPMIPSKKTKDAELLMFDFKDKNLAEIVNIVAAKNRRNIVLPQGAEAIKTTVTFDQKKIRLEDAEHYLDLFLDLAGYMTHQNNGFDVISKKTEKDDVPLHLYVNVPPKDLPHSAENIRAIYYLSNIPVPQGGNTKGNEAVSQILTSIVGANSFMYDNKSNAVILHGNSDKISSAMEIILALDSTGAPEVLEVFPLFHTDAKTVADLLKGQIATRQPKLSGATPPSGRPPSMNDAGFYFTPNTNIIADTRTNSLIMMGSEAALKRIKTFIRDYIDVPMESGESLLRVYDIQYLDAAELAEVLKKLVQRSATGQSDKEAASSQHRFFEDVIIAAEKIEEVKGEQGGKVPALTIGGNRIIVAGKKNDQKIIKDLIDKLDKPEFQVIIEVMILDITVDASKVLAAQTRNPVSLQLPPGISFENANIFNTITGQAPVSPPTTPSLVTDLLANLQLTQGGSKQSIAVNPGTISPNIGATIISFKDPCQDSIWSVLQILDSWTTTSVISHPFLVTKNNELAKNELTFIRRGDGREVASGGVTTIKQEDYQAWIKVDVTPRASSLERLNLQINVEVQNYTDTDPSVFTRTKRRVATNATLNSGQILVLGGLIREIDLETESKWPILGDIPIIGQLFRGVSRAKTKTNLAVILHPTVVHPKMRSGQNRYTNDKINNERSLLTNEELFSSSKDPIIRWFFDDMGGRRGADTMNMYLDDAHYAETHNEGTFNPIDWETADRANRSRAVKAAAVNN